ncbi:MAG: 16S rRNA (guanine(966)-N(2))-methyltransferase RsmD [Candidatus Nitricoxidivorans perseverans]|uniref:16S rRNA (Guanine(966)-N(2))-methyltransferase RsmD n=1 Tax=Candidatus Nitricoxidivorans perseverans TaxID=2975601 RepID=A0AA49FIX2_9PROT|nr:MAG: 16S rRNA (guanine(966)-N(2))-methyltransferase RsmD [Candidatus Nitricoxidivorans perseverans]
MSKVRITGGEWRSRLIQVADAPGLRPTPDRVRETLFNWLGQDLSGLVCLDLFAGSGILGFEAASRGAERVTLVEQDLRVFARLRQNAETLGDGRLEMVRADALEFVALAARQGRRHDIAFLDPPYRHGWLGRLWPVLPPIMNAGGRLYVEAEETVDPPAPWKTARSGKAGQVHYHLFELEAEPST